MARLALTNSLSHAAFSESAQPFRWNRQVATRRVYNKKKTLMFLALCHTLNPGQRTPGRLPGAHPAPLPPANNSLLCVIDSTAFLFTAAQQAAHTPDPRLVQMYVVLLLSVSKSSYFYPPTPHHRHWFTVGVDSKMENSLTYTPPPPLK